ncbi:MAG: CCA tRNA nucleotidyltransferase [Thermoplasmata archaeon]
MNTFRALALPLTKRRFFYPPFFLPSLNVKNILDRIIPTEEEEAQLRDVVSDLIGSAQKEIDRLNVDANAFLTGSVAKNTHLKNPEIDIFIGFSDKTTRKDLERYGLEIGEKVLKGRKMYAEHPYIHGAYRGFEVDIVPCYRLKSAKGKVTAVDRTPFHAKYVIGNLKKGQENEVRLFKQFAKGIGVYGAEAKVQGLSGYLCELLILKYGTFTNLVKNASKWEDRISIELDKKARKDFDDPLNVIDPVDPGRNVASAVSADQLATLIHACKEYLRNPSERFFFPTEPRILTKEELAAEMETRGTHFVCVETGKPDVTDDILYPQLRKMKRAIVELCESEGFAVVDSRFDVTDGKVVLLLEFEIWRLPRAKKRIGPPTTNRNVSGFLARWSKSRLALSRPFIEGSRWVVFIERPNENVQDLLENRIMELSLGKDIRKEAKRGVKIIGGKRILTKDRLGILTALLDKRFPWEY